MKIDFHKWVIEQSIRFDVFVDEIEISSLREILKNKESKPKHFLDEEMLCLLINKGLLQVKFDYWGEDYEPDWNHYISPMGKKFIEFLDSKSTFESFKGIQPNINY